MIFNSTAFLIFILLFFPAYWYISKLFSIGARNLFTIVGSYIFYGFWDWRFLGLIVLSSATDYVVGILLANSVQKRKRLLLLLFSISVNLGILGFFKYFNFFIEALAESAALLSIHLNTSSLRVILPVGISFYTFQTLSYTIDIYKGKLQPTRDFLSFFAFVSFFPQLVAGPIERASNLLGQFQHKKSFDYRACVIGLRLVLWGLFKKIVIADNFGVLADLSFQQSTPLSGLITLAGALFFALQIYADFSGYSDIAIGIARMLGFKLMKNFRTPYFSSSLREFWQRWHISLSTWFRDYVYIPLGGSRRSTGRVYLNILITFLLSGLWHGANYTFLIWGLLHGLFLIVERIISLKKSRATGIILVFILVVLLWIPFRAESTGHLLSLSASLFDLKSYSSGGLIQIIRELSIFRFLSLSLVTLFFFHLEFRLGSFDFSEWIGSKSRWLRWLAYYMLLIGIMMLGNFDVKPYFIYFQF
jgi:D-alanyl-lipoteichoic acid acyltransferase DltB (MBOAT superfamily)